MGEKKKIKSFPIWKRGLAAAACLAVVLGGANIYASSKGYGNVFFMVKYLITGEKPTNVTGKDALLSDRDITISYEPIQLTENIKMQIRRIQIKDNKAVLTLVVQENVQESDTSLVPLKYKVYNSKNEVICEQTSSCERSLNDPYVIESFQYTEKLQLNNLYESDKIINLEINKNDGQKLTKILIDIEAKTITVEGEEEAISKISETDLKKFIGIVSAHPKLSSDDGYEQDLRITLARCLFDDYIDYSAMQTFIPEQGVYAYTTEAINKMLRESGYDEIPNQFGSGLYKRLKYKGEEYFVPIYGMDQFENTCIEITNLSYSAGIYKADFKYITISEDYSFEFDITEDNVLTGTMYFKVNENYDYSKYKIVKFENVASKDPDSMGNNGENNGGNNEENSGKENDHTEPIEDQGDKEQTNSWQNPQSTAPPAKDNPDENATNDISTLNWLEYWSPGLWVQYPDIFSVTTYSDMYSSSTVNYADEKTVEFEGVLKSIDEKTKQVIPSHLKVTVYMPEWVEEKTSPEAYFGKAYKTIFKEDIGNKNIIPEGPASIYNGKSKYAICRYKDGKSYGLYTCYKAADSKHEDGGWGYKIVFESDHIGNPLVKSAIYRILENLRWTSF